MKSEVSDALRSTGFCCLNCRSLVFIAKLKSVTLTGVCVIGLECIPCKHRYVIRWHPHNPTRFVLASRKVYIQNVGRKQLYRDWAPLAKKRKRT